jgi:glucose/arabinose dehydrogenase
MIADSIASKRIRPVARLASAVFVAASFGFTASGAIPFTVQGPGVNPGDFRITVFAGSLDFPLGMARLDDGSLLVAVSKGTSFFSSTGRLLRFADTNQDGVADGPGTLLYDNLPGSQSALRVHGKLVFVTGQAKPMTILRTGASPSDPLTLAGRIGINYGGSWYHPNSALGIRETPGQTNSCDLLFQLGSDSNFAATMRTVTLTNDSVPGATGVLPGDSAYLITITDHGTNITATNLTRFASGLRNPAGYAFHPATGDLYFQDNGIDGLVDANEPTSADELNFIARTNLGGLTENFGYPANYTAYRSNIVVGGAGVQPLIAFQPIPDPFTGHESEGANDVVFAPPGFPDGLNRGVLIGFHGRFNAGGTTNEENPVVYADPATGDYFHFIEGRQPGIGHLDGLLATRDSLFVADLVTTGNTGSGAGAGVIYQIKSLANPAAPTLEARAVGSQIELNWDGGTLQESDGVNESWNDVVDAFSPLRIQATRPIRFYRTRY